MTSYLGDTTDWTDTIAGLGDIMESFANELPGPVGKLVIAFGLVVAVVVLALAVTGLPQTLFSRLAKKF